MDKDKIFKGYIIERAQAERRRRRRRKKQIKTVVIAMVIAMLAGLLIYEHSTASRWVAVDDGNVVIATDY